MPTCEPFSDYIAYVDAHPQWINDDRRLLISNILRPVIESDAIDFDEGTFEKAVQFAQSAWDIELVPYQRMIYAAAFLYWIDNPRPVFPRLVILEGRGNGKDGLAVPLATFFMTPLYGEREYNVDIVAAGEKQASDTFMVAYNALSSSPKLSRLFKTNLASIRDKQTGAIMRYNTSNAGTKDGKKIGCCIFNEIHAYANYDQINVFTSAQGKATGQAALRPARTTYPRQIWITTNGYVRDGVLDDMIAKSRGILESGDLTAGIFPFLCRLDSTSEVGDMEAMHKANPSLEYFPLLASEITAEYRDAQATASLMPEFITKRCNLPAAQQTAEPVTSWKNILRCSYTGDTDAELERRMPRPVPSTDGQPAIIGIDYADIRDFASVGVLTSSGTDFIWQQHSWIDSRNSKFAKLKFPLSNYGRPGFTDFTVVDDPVIPIEALCDYIAELMGRYSVVKISLDTYRYSLFKAAFTARGWSIESKANPYGIIRLIRRVGSVSGIIAPYIQQQFELGHIIYGDSAIMRWYTNNVALAVDRLGNAQFGKIEPILRKTDGFMAFAAAMYSHDLLERSVIYV